MTWVVYQYGSSHISGGAQGRCYRKWRYRKSRDRKRPWSWLTGPNRKSRKWSRVHAKPVPALFSYYNSSIWARTKSYLWWSYWKLSRAHAQPCNVLLIVVCPIALFLLAIVLSVLLLLTASDCFKLFLYVLHVHSTIYCIYSSYSSALHHLLSSAKFN